MADLTITAADVAPVFVIEQFTGPAAEAIAAGQYVRFNTTNGKVELGKATTAAEARDGGIAITTATAAGDPVTAVRSGCVDLGDALAALNYDADVYLSDTDGTLADSAGTIAKVIGQVVPAWGQTTADKLLRVDMATSPELLDEIVTLAKMADLARGSIITGQTASNRPTALNAKTSGQILVGDGTDLVSVAVSGDVTLAANGAVTIANTQHVAGDQVENVANANVVGGVPLVHRVTLPSGANADTDVTLTHKTLVVDFWFALKGAGTAGSTVTLKNGATAISDAIDASAGGDRDVFRAAEIDDAQDEIAAAGTLRITHASAGGDFPGAEAYVMGLRIA